MFENVNNRIACSGVGVAAQPNRLGDEQSTEHRGGDDVDRAHGVGRERQRERGRDDDERVHDDLAHRGGDALHHREHRDPGRLVVVAVPQRQRPEVRRGPEEHDGEQHPRGGGEVAGDRGPARRAPAPHRRRRRSRCSAGSGASARSCTRTRRRAWRSPRARPTAGSTVDHSSANASASSTSPNTSAPSGLTSPAGSGRCAVRRIIWSRSRSIQQLMVLAPPAASAPPTSTAAMSPSDGSRRRPGPSPAPW